MHFDTNGIILNKLLGKQCWRLQVITSNSEVITCFQRQSKKAGKSIQADLFDSASLLLKNTRSSSAHFVEEYQLLHRRTALATHYKNFFWATRFSKILLKNPLHTETNPELYKLTQAALDYWSEGKPGAIVYFKALYKLIRLEGLPIKETWLAGLSSPEQAYALTLLNTSIQSLRENKDLPYKELASSLERWITQHTAIHC